MSTQKPMHVTTQLHVEDVKGGLRKPAPHCIAYKLPKEVVLSLLEGISKNTTPPQHESSIYTTSAEWIYSLATAIANELSATFNAPATSFQETARDIANVVSTVGNGTWSGGITPVNAIKALETNFPLYISDFYDQLAGWSRENLFEHCCDRIGSDTSRIGGSNKPHHAEGHGPESALSDKYAKISWNVPSFRRTFNVSTAPSFGTDGEPSNGEVYRYFAFIDDFKLAISMKEDGSIAKELYNFTNPAQLWRVENYGSFYALYNKKHKAYLGRSLKGVVNKPDNNWHESAVYLVENPDTHTYSIGSTQNNSSIDYLLKDVHLVTVPLVAWRNASGQFLTVDPNSGALGFTEGKTHHHGVIPEPEQLFGYTPHPDFAYRAIVFGHNGKLLEFDPRTNKTSCSHDLKSPARLAFALFEYDQNIWPRGTNHLATRLTQTLVAAAPPPPGKGTRVRVWKADPSVQQIGIRELFLLNTDIKAGPQDSLFDTKSTTGSISPDSNGDFLLNFENTPPRVPESDNHVRFDVIHTFSAVRYVFNLLSSDLEYLDGRPPVINRPWGNKKLTIHPHAGEDANAFYSRQEGVLKFFYTRQGNSQPVYLCRSFDVVAHEAGHAFLDTLQPGWLSDGQTGGFHEAFGDLCSLFTLISMAEIADLFITTTKANLRNPDNFLSAVGEEFGDALYKNKGKGLRNLSNTLKGSQAEAEVHAVSQVFSGFYYDVLVDVFALERSTVKGDADTLMDVGTTLRRALIIAIRVSSAQPTRTKFQEIATNLETALGTLGRKLGVDLSSWAEIVRKYARDRELSLAGLSR